MSSEESENDSVIGNGWISDTDSDEDATTSQAISSASANSSFTQDEDSSQSQRGVLRRHGDGQNLREPVAGTSTGIVSRISPRNPSRISSPPESRKRRKSSGSGNKSRSKKRKKPSQSQSTSSNNGVNGNIDNQSPGNPSEDDSESEEDLNDGDDKHRITSQHFSIHRLPVKKLRKRFEGVEEEQDLVEAIMEQVNEKQRKFNQKHGRQLERKIVKFGKFEKMEPAEIPTEVGVSAEVAEEALFEFKVLFYAQAKTTKYDFFVRFNIPTDLGPRCVNSIIFFYRSGDIYALTVQQTWQLIQVYSCYDFPCQISGRLRNTEGSNQEILFHLTGNVCASQSLKKNPMRYDKLNSVVINVIKPLRDNCSLYRLTEFTETTRKEVKVKLQIGLGYVRIKRMMDIKNLPEILDHFTKICEGKPTYTFPGNQAEEQMNDVPYLHGVSGEVKESAKEKLSDLIWRCVRNGDQELIQKFYLSDKYRDDFYNAEDYKMTCHDNVVAQFSSCPSLSQVCSAVKQKWASDLLPGGQLTKTTFTNRIKKHIKIGYNVKGSAIPISRPLFSLLEGEIAINSGDVWKLMGKWMVVREDYNYQVHAKFLDLLKKDKGGIFKYGRRVHLIKNWNVGNIRSVKDYCKQYETEKGYFLFKPDADSLENNNPNCAVAESHFFDMLKVIRDDKGKLSFWIYYVFDRFDVGIRDASMRITKSLDMLFPNEAPTSNSESLLEKFWWDHTENENLSRLFDNKCESFCDLMTTRPLNIVVTFATQFQRLNSRVSAGKSSQSSRPQAELPTLKREQKLKLDVPKDDMVKLIHENVKFDELCGHLEISPQSDKTNDDFYQLMATPVLKRLVDSGYFTEIPCQRDKLRYRVTGAFLKLRNYEAFEISDDLVTNQKYTKFFRKLQELYTSGFPGFTHKLECFQIHENVTKESRLKLYISEVL